MPNVRAHDPYSPVAVGDVPEPEEVVEPPAPEPAPEPEPVKTGKGKTKAKTADPEPEEADPVAAALAELDAVRAESE